MPPLIPFIPLIAAGVGGASALGAAKMAGNSNKNIAQMQLNAAEAAQARSKPAYDQAYNYYSGLLSGDPSNVSKALAPDINNVNAMFASAQRNLVGNSMGRGGGLTAGMANIEGARAMSMSDLIGRSRGGAASALSALASGDQNAALRALADSQNSTTQNNKANSDALSGIGSFITRLLSTPGLFSKQGNDVWQGGYNAPWQGPTQGIPPAVISNPGNPFTQDPYKGFA